MNILPLELLLFLHGMLSFIFFSLIPTKMMSSKLIAEVANKAKRPIDKNNTGFVSTKKRFCRKNFQ